MNNKNSRTNALPGLRKKNGPTNDTGTRTDSTTRFDPITLRVDSTPVGQKKVDSGGYGWSAALSSGNKPVDMWKNIRDEIATNKVSESNKEKSRASKPGSGNMTMIMPGE
tara:strand:+ start:101 stop:430 length:330 start_codon:yes stop_codon:yes gene_type:complete